MLISPIVPMLLDSKDGDKDFVENDDLVKMADVTIFVVRCVLPNLAVTVFVRKSFVTGVRETDNVVSLKVDSAEDTISKVEIGLIILPDGFWDDEDVNS